MTFLELKQMLDESFQRSDLEHNYGRWINQAIRKVQQDRDWGCMRDRREVSFAHGALTATMPDNYKALTEEQFPIHVRSSTFQEYLPCEVVSYEKATRYRSSTYYPPILTTTLSARRGVPVFVEQLRDAFWLTLTAPAAEALVFQVSYYGFLPDLAADGDSNHLTREYPEMVEAKVKALAFGRVNEFKEMVEPNEILYTTRSREAGIDDFRRSNQGRKLRMGG